MAELSKKQQRAQRTAAVMSDPANGVSEPVNPEDIQKQESGWVPGQLVVARETDRGLSLDPNAAGPERSVRLAKGCKVVDAPFGGSKGIQHPELVITEEWNPRKGKQQIVSLRTAVEKGYARVE